MSNYLKDFSLVYDFPPDPPIGVRSENTNGVVGERSVKRKQTM